MAQIDKDQVEIGKDYWVCDFRYTNYTDKPIRHVKPCKVQAVHVSETPKYRRIYYSDYFFRPYGKSGKLLQQVIPVVDNTGYRHRSGTPLSIFDNYEECKKAYDTMAIKNAAEFRSLGQSFLNYAAKLMEEVD